MSRGAFVLGVALVLLFGLMVVVDALSSPAEATASTRSLSLELSEQLKAWKIKRQLKQQELKMKKTLQLMMKEAKADEASQEESQQKDDLLILHTATASGPKVKIKIPILE